MAPTSVPLSPFLGRLLLSGNEYKLTVITKSKMNIAGRNHQSPQRRADMLEALNTLTLKLQEQILKLSFGSVTKDNLQISLGRI